MLLLVGRVAGEKEREREKHGVEWGVIAKRRLDFSKLTPPHTQACVPVPGRFKCAGPVGGAAGKSCGACEYAEQDGDADHCVPIPADVCGSAEFKPAPPPSSVAAPAPSPAAVTAPAPTAGLPRTAGGEILGSTRPSGATTVPDAAEVAAMQAAEDDAPAAPVPLPVRPKGPHPPPRH